MSTVSIRELRNHGGEVVARAAKGETLTVTRSGKPVAELHPLAREPKSLDALLKSRRHLAPVDPAQMREDIDQLLDPTL